MRLVNEVAHRDRVNDQRERGEEGDCGEGEAERREPRNEAIEAAAAKAEQEAFPVTEATAAAALKDLQTKGMMIHVQTPPEQQAWKAAMQKPVMDAFLKSAPADGPKIVELLQKL